MKPSHQDINGLLSLIPNDVLTEILSYLSIKDIITLRSLSKKQKDDIDQILQNEAQINRIIKNLDPASCLQFINKCEALYGNKVQNSIATALSKNPDKIVGILRQLPAIEGLQFVKKYKNLCKDETEKWISDYEREYTAALKKYNEDYAAYEKAKQEYEQNVKQQQDEIDLYNSKLKNYINENKEKNNKNSSQIPNKPYLKILIEPSQPQKPAYASITFEQITQFICYTLTTDDISNIQKLIEHNHTDLMEKIYRSHADSYTLKSQELPGKKMQKFSVDFYNFFSDISLEDDFILSLKLSDIPSQSSDPDRIHMHLEKLTQTDKEVFINLKGIKIFSNTIFNRKTSISLANKNLSYLDFSNSKLNGYDFCNSLLVSINFFNTSLQKANLSYSNLDSANLENADLSGTNLTGAYLVRANLKGIKIQGANLNGAIFLDNEDFITTVSLDNKLSRLHEMINQNPNISDFQEAIADNIIRNISKIAKKDHALALSLLTKAENNVLIASYKLVKPAKYEKADTGIFGFFKTADENNNNNKMSIIEEKFLDCKKQIMASVTYSQPKVVKRIEIIDQELREQLTMKIHKRLEHFKNIFDQTNEGHAEKNHLDEYIQICQTLKYGLINTSIPVMDQIKFCISECKKIKTSFINKEISFLNELLKDSHNFQLSKSNRRDVKA